MTLGGTAGADFIGLTWSYVDVDVLGNPLEDLPGFPGHTIIEVYAEFNNPKDQLVGVVGSPDNPFNVQTSDGSGCNPQSHSR